MNDEVTLGGTAASQRPRGFAVLWCAYLGALCWAAAAGVAFEGLPQVAVVAVALLAAALVLFFFSLRCDSAAIAVPYGSIAPVPVALYWLAAGEPGPLPVRQLAVVLLVVVWSACLTGSVLTRWEGLDGEAPRGAALHGRGRRARWVASLAAIQLTSAACVLLGMLPLHPALASPGRALGPLDALALAVTAGAILVEAVAGLQLRRFVRTRSDPAQVLTSGLWAFSRHPNYLGEVLFWWGLYLFGVAAAPDGAWTIVGPAAITLRLLLLDVPRRDRRMASRHPAWAARMRTVPALFPWPRRAVAPTPGDR